MELVELSQVLGGRLNIVRFYSYHDQFMNVFRQQHVLWIQDNRLDIFSEFIRRKPKFSSSRSEGGADSGSNNDDVRRPGHLGRIRLFRWRFRGC